MTHPTHPPLPFAPAPAPHTAPQPAPQPTVMPQQPQQPMYTAPAQVPVQVYPAAQVRPAGALVTYGQGAHQPAPATRSPLEGVTVFVEENKREIIAAGLGALAISLLRGGRLPNFTRGGGSTG